MKKSIMIMSFASVLALGLTACGGGGDGSGSSSGGSSSGGSSSGGSSSGGSSSGGSAGPGAQFKGTWKTDCTTAGTRSFKQTWDLKADGTLSNSIPVWDTNTTCTGTPRGPAVADVKIDYKGEIDVANTCVGGKAQKIDAEFKKVDVGSLGTFTGDTAIRTILSGQGLKFPKYDIMCLDASGNLHTGDTSGANDGSTVAKRPTEINPNATFHK